MALNRARTNHIGVALGLAFGVLRTRGLEAVGIFLAVFELERVFGDLRHFEQFEAFIEQQFEPRIGTDAPVMVALWTYA